MFSVGQHLEPGRTVATKRKRERISPLPFKSTPGSDLLSHALTNAVPSALEGLTSVFGMGTGVAPPASPPGMIDDEFDVEGQGG